MNKAVFLDRDGVITEDPPHYAHRVDQVRIIPKSGEAIRLLNEMCYQVIVVSNQSGVAKGYYQECDIELFNEEVKRQLAFWGAHIDAIYYCPHHPDAEIEKYRLTCNCRKPKPGMILHAANEHNIDLQKSYVVGDKWSDIEAGKNAGSQVILVLTGHGTEEASKMKDCNGLLAADLYEAVNKYIIGKNSIYVNASENKNSS